MPAMPAVLGLVLALSSLGAADQTCDSCMDQVAALQATWTNDTEVAAILEGLEEQCRDEYPRDPVHRAVCDKVAEAKVQIPPALFHGMETVAWPIPLGVCATLEICSLPCCSTGNSPEQVHLSLASKDQSLMGVSWVTLDEVDSVVQFRLAGSDVDYSTESGTVHTYTQGGWVGNIHQATMRGLEPETTYSYRVGDGADAWSDEFEFTTLPADPAEPLVFAVLGDMGYGNSSNGTIAALTKLVDEGAIHAVVHSGDVSYADGFMPHWDVFLNKVQPIASRVPYMVTPGNHELWYNFTAYKARFFMPGVIDEGGSGDNMYYSWRAGSAFFIAGNSETAVDTAWFSSTEQEWMAAELSAMDRDVTPWAIAHFHRPLYCSNSKQNARFGKLLQAQVEDLFLDHGVNLVIQAHVHSYERTYPMYKMNASQFDYVSPKTPTYIIQGASGNREGNSGFPQTLPEWSAAHSSEIGFGLLTVKPDTLDWSFFTVDDNGAASLEDQFQLQA